MSDFWARKLAQQQPAPPPRQEPVQGIAPAAWWVDETLPEQAPAQQTNLNQGPTLTPHPGQPATSPKAQSSRSTAHCPNCSSGNYFAVPGAKDRCYDCGYPVVQQFSGAGMPTPHGESATPTQQIAEAGYQPGQIIGHIG